MVDKMIRDWQFPLSLGRPSSETINSGVHVIGRDTSTGKLWMWYFPDKKAAETFAKNIAQKTQSAYYIMEPISMVMPDKPTISTFEYDNKPKRKGKSNG